MASQGDSQRGWIRVKARFNAGIQSASRPLLKITRALWMTMATMALNTERKIPALTRRDSVSLPWLFNR